jgi:hypothetical protein
VAQLGSALALGARSRGFNSLHPDHLAMILPGHSGDKVEVFTSDGKRYVRKTSKRTKKLQRQASLLQVIAGRNYDGIVAPKILDYNFSGSLSRAGTYVMEYYEGKDAIEFFSTCSPSQLAEAGAIIVNFLLANFVKETRLRPFNHMILAEKLTQIPLPEDIMAQALDYIANLPPGPITRGFTHGDLTFSNMIFGDGEICFIDPNPPVYSTILEDIAKLKQDTVYNWTAHFYPERCYDRVRYNYARKYIDDLIDSSFSRFTEYRYYYRAFQLMNFLRIYPYCTDETRPYVVAHIYDMLEEWI